jgi:phage FluMu protein Com
MVQTKVAPQARVLPKEIPEEMREKVKEFHCPNCGRFLAFYAIIEGTIAVKCRRCKEVCVLDIQSTP